MRSLIRKYGWKSIAGTVIIGLAQLLKMSEKTAEYAPIAESLGVVLGGVGFRVALAKIETETKKKEKSHA